MHACCLCAYVFCCCYRPYSHGASLPLVTGDILGARRGGPHARPGVRAGRARHHRLLRGCGRAADGDVLGHVAQVHPRPCRGVSHQSSQGKVHAYSLVGQWTGGYLGWTNGPLVALDERTDRWLSRFDERTVGCLGWTNERTDAVTWLPCLDAVPSLGGAMALYRPLFVCFSQEVLWKAFLAGGTGDGSTTFKICFCVFFFRDSRAANRLI